MNALFQFVPIAAEAWIARLWRASVEGFVAILVVWLIMRLWQSLSPRIVCWLWRLVCFKLIVGLVWIQPVPLALLPAPTRNRTTETAISFAQSPENQLTATAAAVLPNTDNSAQANHGRAELPMHNPTNSASLFAFSWSETLTAMWIVGVLLAIAASVKQYLAIRYLRNASRPVHDAELPAILVAEAKKLQIHRLPELRHASADVGPMLVGILRPTIILPNMKNFSTAELRLMLIHELAHARRHDLTWNWLCTIAGWLFFFHPLMWLLRRMWLLAQEAGCDELVLQSQTVWPSEYGKLLFKLSEVGPQPLRVTLAAAQVVGSFRNLERRIIAMTNVKSFSRRKIAVAAGLLLSVAALSLVPWRLVAQEQKPDTATKQAGGSGDSKAEWKTRELLQSAKNLHDLVVAMQTYLDMAGHFPAFYTGWGYDDKLGEWYKDRPNLSWRVAILPLIGQQELFSKFKFDQPWDSEHNKKLIADMPAIFHDPGSKAGPGKTNYLAVVGPNAAFPDKGTIGVGEFTDGTTKTIMLVEVPDDRAVEWTKPDEFPMDSKDAIGKLVGLRKGGFLSVFADASPHFIGDSISPKMLRDLLCRNDGNAFSQQEYDLWDRSNHGITIAEMKSVESPKP